MLSDSRATDQSFEACRPPVDGSGELQVLVCIAISHIKRLKCDLKAQHEPASCLNVCQRIETMSAAKLFNVLNSCVTKSCRIHRPFVTDAAQE